MVPTVAENSKFFVYLLLLLLGLGQIQSPTGQPTSGACTNSAWPTQCVQVEKMHSNTILEELTGAYI